MRRVAPVAACVASQRGGCVVGGFVAVDHFLCLCFGMDVGRDAGEGCETGVVALAVCLIFLVESLVEELLRIGEILLKGCVGGVGGECLCGLPEVVFFVGSDHSLLGIATGKDLVALETVFRHHVVGERTALHGIAATELSDLLE